MSDLVNRLFDDASQLRKCVKLAAFGGEETGVRVKSPDLLLADIDEATAVLTEQAAELSRLRKEVADLREAARPLVEIARDIAEKHPGWDHDEFCFTKQGWPYTVKLGPFRRLAVLTEGEGK